MRTFINELTIDVRGGHQSWRVYAASSLIGFAAATVNVLVGRL